MTLQTRVTPFGEIVAEPWRGGLMGNRGRLHDDAGRIGTPRWRTHAWVACRLAFRGRWRPPMPPGRWTALFFWDEPMAFAAGHRPCGECRHADHRRFAEAWAAAGLPGRLAREIDRHLHPARVGRDRRQVTHRSRLGDLPDGTVIRHPAELEAACLIWREALHPWNRGYGAPVSLPPASAEVEVLTPAPVVDAFRAGYLPAPRLS